MNTRSSITQPPVAPCAGCLIQTTNKTKIQTQSSADRIIASLSLTHQRNNKQTNKNFAQISSQAHTNHWTNLRRAETKRKKEFNLLQGKNSTFLEAWEKETSNTISLKKYNEKAEKHYTRSFSILPLAG